MTIVTHTIANQDAVARRLIQSGEGNNLTGPTNVGDHTVTLGFGFTFIRRGGNNKWARLGSLTDDLATIGVTLTGAQDAQLRSIADELNTLNHATQADQLIDQFRSSWTAAPITEPQAEILFGTELDRARRAIKTQFRKILNPSDPADGNALYAALEGTREMAGLLSLAYNAQTLIGPGLINALWQGDRAEAWFQIRYESNSPAQAADIRAGLAKRRFVEAQYIGLYADPSTATENEVKNAFAMLQKHRETILSYEATFGSPPNGTTPSNGNRIATAISDFGAAMTFGEVTLPSSLVQSLNPAKTALLTDLRTTQYTDLASWFADGNFVSTNIYVAPDSTKAVTLDSALYQKGSFANGAADLMMGGTQGDTLKGNKGNDVLIGNGGDDTLDGGEGDDLLIGSTGRDRLLGGLGTDTYAFKAGEGKDTIKDSDGLGKVMLAGNQLTGAGKSDYQPDNGKAIWTVNGGQVVYELNEAQKILTIKGTSLSDGNITIEDFDISKVGGYLGITLEREVKGAVVQAGQASPFAIAGGSANTISKNIIEQAGAAFSWFTNVTSKLGDSITVSARSGDGSLLSLVTGAQTLDLSSAQTINLSEGQFQRDFAIISDSAFDSDQNIELIVTYHHAGQEVESNAINLTLKDTGETSKTFLGDQRAKLIGTEIDQNITPDNPKFGTYKWAATSWASDGSLMGGVAQADFADVIYGSTGNDKIDGKGGNDALDGGGGRSESAIKSVAGHVRKQGLVATFSSQKRACRRLKRAQTRKNAKLVAKSIARFSQSKHSIGA